MNDSNPQSALEAKAAYDHACGAAVGARDMGFILALTLAFWIGDQLPYKYLAMAIIGLLIMLAVRAYYGRRIELAQDAYHRAGKLGKYAAGMPAGADSGA